MRLHQFPIVGIQAASCSRGRNGLVNYPHDGASLAYELVAHKQHNFRAVWMEIASRLVDQNMRGLFANVRASH